MFLKAKFFIDEEIAQMVLDTPSPRYVKELGRAIKNYNDSEVNYIKDNLEYLLDYLDVEEK